MKSLFVNGVPGGLDYTIMNDMNVAINLDVLSFQESHTYVSSTASISCQF